MSIRDDLVTIVEYADAAHDTDPRPFPDRIVDAILARYAVVELPEPDADTGRLAWHYHVHDEHNGNGIVRVLPFSTGPKIATLGGQFHTPDTARALAAALLAAANHAEAQSSRTTET